MNFHITFGEKNLIVKNMSQQYRMLNQQKELDLQIKELKNTLVKEKARCFKVLNDSQPYIPKFGPSAQKILDEFNSLCQYYGIDPDSVKDQDDQLNSTEISPATKSATGKSPSKSPAKSPAKSFSKSASIHAKNPIVDSYYNKMQSFHQEENRKREELAKLNQRLLVLQKENDNLANEKHSKTVTIEKSFNSLKSQLNSIRDYFSNFTSDVQSKINMAKKMVAKVISEKRKRSQSQINILDKKIDDLQAQKNGIIQQKKDKLSRLSFQSIEDQSVDYSYSNEKLRSVILQSAKEVQSKFEERLKTSPMNEKINLIFGKIDISTNQLDLINQKINLLREKRAKSLSETIIHNWGVLTYTLLKLGRYQHAIDEYYEEVKKQDEEVLNLLKSESDLVNAKVPGTNLTILELRKEVIRLTNELKELTKTKTAELKALENEHTKLKEESQKVIEQLEAQLD